MYFLVKTGNAVADHRCVQSFKKCTFCTFGQKSTHAKHRSSQKVCDAKSCCTRFYKSCRFVSHFYRALNSYHVRIGHLVQSTKDRDLVSPSHVQREKSAQSTKKCNILKRQKYTFDQKPCFALQVLEHLTPLEPSTLKLARQSKVFGKKYLFW